MTNYVRLNDGTWVPDANYRYIERWEEDEDGVSAD